MPMDWEEWQKKRQKGSSPRKPDNGEDGPQLPNLNNLISKFKKAGGSSKPPLWLPLPIILAVWLLSGFFTVEPYERGLIKRFGQYSASVEEGLRYHLPWPIETVTKVNYTQTRQFEVGGGRGGASGLDEATMLTNDENIVNVQFVVQYKVDDPVAYAFHIYDPDKTIRDAAISAMREVIGRNTIYGALTDQRASIQEDTRETLQGMMVKYDTGLMVNNVELQDVHVPADVIQAFKDVTSAREDSERFINEARGYRNNKLPEAEAKAYAVIAQAQAYKAERVNIAQGDAARFTALLIEYRKAPEVTRQRLILETMDKVLPGVDKYLIGGQSGQGVLPLLGLNNPLPRLESPPPASISGGSYTQGK
ncbi:MAG: FtsH protease activity modulator HflK, partial [Deltaproteobacteria bacterium]|jgi:membrane protease subunit HflK|nr:FtsH protease activity modulator HflK [Deltaproteobacteria bacterium]